MKKCYDIRALDVSKVILLGEYRVLWGERK